MPAARWARRAARAGGRASAWRRISGSLRAASAWRPWHRIAHARNMPMRIAFYAPLKSPTHGTPSGDRRIAGLFMDALARAGHRVELASTFRSYDAAGAAPRPAAL